MYCGWWITWSNHNPALSDVYSQHVHLSTRHWLRSADFLTLPHPAACSHFAWHIIIKFEYLRHVQQVCAESNAVAYMDECCMTVVIQKDWYCALTTPSMTHMTSHAWFLLVNLITTILFISHWTVTGEKISSVLVIVQLDFESKHLPCCEWPLHMQQRIIVFRNLDTEIKNKLQCSKIGILIACQWDMMSNNFIYLSIFLTTQEPLSLLRPNAISVRWSAGKAICKGRSFEVQHASHWGWWINRPPCLVEDTLCLCWLRLPRT